VLKEDQIIRLFFEDKKTRDLQQRDFVRMVEYEAFEVIKETREEDGNIYYTARNKEGREVVIGNQYVN